MKSSYKTILFSTVLMLGCDSQNTEKTPPPKKTTLNIQSNKIKINKEIRVDEKDTITKYGYAITDDYYSMFHKFSQENISAVTFQTIKNDTPKRLAEILYGKDLQWSTTEEAEENLVFHQKNYESHSVKSKGFTENVSFPEGTILRTYFWNRKISYFTNKYPERNLQILSNTPEYFAADTGYGEKIEDIYDLATVGRFNLPFVSFNTLKGDTLEKLDKMLYKNDFFSYYLTHPEVYENPELKGYDSKQPLPVNVQVRTFMYPYQYTAFTNRFPERKARIIPPQLSPDLIKLLSRTSQ